MSNNLEKNYSLQTVRRAVQILRTFSRDKKQLTLTEIHDITGIGKSSLQRLLFTLVQENLLMKTEKKSINLD